MNNTTYMHMYVRKNDNNNNSINNNNSNKNHNNPPPSTTRLYTTTIRRITMGCERNFPCTSWGFLKWFWGSRNFCEGFPTHLSANCLKGFENIRKFRAVFPTHCQKRFKALGPNRASMIGISAEFPMHSPESCLKWCWKFRELCEELAMHYCETFHKGFEFCCEFCEDFAMHLQR